MMAISAANWHGLRGGTAARPIGGWRRSTNGERRRAGLREAGCDMVDCGVQQGAAMVGRRR